MRGVLVTVGGGSRSADSRNTFAGHSHLARTPRLLGVVPVVVAALAILSAEPLLAAAVPRHAFVVAQSETATPAKPLPGNPSPPYPGPALEAGVEGECVFRADVTPEGTVSKVAVLQVPKEGLGFETAVEKTVAAWHFEPARRGGTKTASVYVGTINYSLLSVNLGRMYSLSASLTWKKLLEWIERTGLKTKEVDPAHQLVMTKLINVRGGPLPFPKTVGSGYVPRRFQIQVFVSPYAEPARVYVASLVEADRRTSDGTDVWTVYNSPVPSTWLFQEFSKYLGDPGRAMPETTMARTALANQLRPDASAPTCTPSKTARPLAPPVRFFSLSPVFPAQMLQERRAGQVRYEFHIEEDGSVEFSRFLDTPANQQALAANTPQDEPTLAANTPEDQPFLDAARASLTFWRFEPTRLNGCPVVVTGTSTVNFTFK